MIFLYPAIISQTVDTKIGIAVARVLEQYFLLHLQEAIQSGIIRIETNWIPKGVSPSGGVYGPLHIVAENSWKKGNLMLESLLKESDNDDEKGIETKISELRQSVKDIVYNPKDYNILEMDTLQIEKAKVMLTHTAQVLQTALFNAQEYNSTLNRLVIDKPSLKEIIKNKYRPDLQQFISGLEIKINGINETLKLINHYLVKSGKDTIGKEKREQEKAEREKLAQYELHGSYKVEPIKGVSLKPTMANISVKIVYRGGPHQTQQYLTTQSGQYQEVAIGTKVLPIRISNYGRIEDAILDDYFTTKITSVWRSYYRSALRWLVATIENILKRTGLSNLGISIKQHLDPVKANILLSTHGFMDSSSFEQGGRKPSFYIYSASIVIFDKRDLIKDEGVNFFLNKSKLQDMFKMGWNSFCILDSVKEEAIFVSSLDGGHMHVIPYSYIFNSLGMDQIYQNINDLQRRSPVFRTSQGNFNTFISRMRRESKLLKVVKTIQEKIHAR